MAGDRLRSRLSELLEEEARAEGFPLSGAVDIEPALAGEYPGHVARYDRWIARGSEGAMEYVKRGRDRRADPRVVFPGAKAVFSVALPYPRRAAGAPDPGQGPRYARYLQGPDYHVEIAAMLERAMARVRDRFGEPMSWKVCVDTSAVLERSWAALAGLGWIGKNTMLIHPKLGSYLFLGEVLIDRETGDMPRPLPDYCGHCERCLTACPTGALLEARDLESRKCISYLTLEKRGEIEMPHAERERLGSWVAGCDLCQEACPYNLKAVRAEEALPAPTLEHDVTLDRDWLALLDESEEGYRARVRKSAMSRIKPAQWRRNLARALANAARAMSTEARDAALPRVRARLAAETDEPARGEWARCLEALSR